MSTVNVTYSDTVGGGMHQGKYGCNPPINKKKKPTLPMSQCQTLNLSDVGLACQASTIA